MDREAGMTSWACAGTTKRFRTGPQLLLLQGGTDSLDDAELEYVEPTQVVRSFGYDVFANEVSEEALGELDRTVSKAGVTG